MMSARPPASLGRRLLPALALTTAASGLVAVLDQSSSGAAVDLGGDSAVAPGQTVVTVTSDLPSVSSTTPAVVEAVPTSQSAASQPSSSPTSTAPTTTASSSTCVGETIDGSTIETRWGPVQVEAVVSTSGQICNVDAIQSPDDHSRSVRINDSALPILHTQVIDAQSANIDGVSGATITSVGYQRSLQSILDSLG